jgi:hypothetical protein
MRGKGAWQTQVYRIAATFDLPFPEFIGVYLRSSVV